MSCEREPPPLEPPDELDRPLVDVDEDDPVEYFVEVELDESPVVSSVPNSVHSSQTSNSAPSTFTRFGEDVSAPHISH
jgi:hypothetical protein